MDSVRSRQRFLVIVRGLDGATRQVLVATDVYVRSASNGGLCIAKILAMEYLDEHFDWSRVLGTGDRVVALYSVLPQTRWFQ